MTIAFEAVNSAVSGSAVSALSFSLPSAAARQLLVATFGFENVLASSGPWVAEGDGTGSPPKAGAATGWERIVYQAPSADGGCGVEVWATLWGSGTAGQFVFDTSRTLTYQIARYTGIYDTGATIPGFRPVSGGIVRASTKQQWTGANPQAPSVYAFQNELVLAVGAEIVNTPGFGTPTPAGWTKRVDTARSSSFSNVSVTLADMNAAVSGDTGAIPWSAAVTGSPKGATATIAIRPKPLPSGPGSAPLSFRFKPA